ncbi:hypothetical protein FTO74_05845 [Granulicella sp. WH15]|uniref:hypothetical protein n=1 Tax=Granulicella sp. WH15 TaxID=2602070 RepID=UPI001367719D|nr:hypothetical protein [Granulicella sp. WH15]QHN02945.1 hypothetical protein FTO74_05845 [Granulicella sp. WH15]
MNLNLQSFRRIVIVHATILAASPVLFAQAVPAQNTPVTDSSSAVFSSPSIPHIEHPKYHVETSVSVGSMAQLSADRVSDTKTDLMTQSLSPSAGVFATFRQSFKPWLGYSVNFGYTHSTYRYTDTVLAPTNSTGTTSNTLIPAHMYEVSVSYIAQKHLTNRLTAFGEAGGGTVAFAANNIGGYLPRRSNTFLPEVIAGFGVDYRLPHGLGLRAQYRGLFIRYPYPDYDLSIRLKTIVSEPTLSLTYTFGRHPHQAPN